MVLKTTTYYEVDDNIANTIILLNNKGYKTKYCCSGHAERGQMINYCQRKVAYFGTYLYFDEESSKVLSSLEKNKKPNNWVQDANFDDFVIRRYFTEEELERHYTVEQLLQKAWNELKDWVINLKYNDYDFDYILCETTKYTEE